MSAWVCSQLHIDVLVQALGVRELVVEDPDKVGRTLWEENIGNVSAVYGGRYDDENPDPSTYRYVAPTLEQIRAVCAPHYTIPEEGLTPSVLLALLDCYDYQCMDRPSYEHSTAKEYVSKLWTALVAAGANATSSEYHQAPWGV